MSFTNPNFPSSIHSPTVSLLCCVPVVVVVVVLVGRSARKAKDRNYKESSLSAKTRQQPPLQKRDSYPSKDHEPLRYPFCLSYSQVS